MCGFNNRVEISAFQGYGHPTELNGLAFPYLIWPTCKPFLDISTPLAKLLSWEFPMCNLFLFEGYVTLHLMYMYRNIWQKQVWVLCKVCWVGRRARKMQAQVTSRISIFACLYLLRFFSLCQYSTWSPFRYVKKAILTPMFVSFFHPNLLYYLFIIRWQNTGMNEIINKGYSKLLSTVIYFNCQQEIWQVSPFLQIEVRSSLY